MQFSIPQIRHSNDLYYISVNLLHIQKGNFGVLARMREKCTVFFEAFLPNICVIKKILLILQRETFDTDHSSAGKCTFCRTGEAREAAEQRFAVLLPNG